jgi:hypothetical protein
MYSCGLEMTHGGTWVSIAYYANIESWKPEDAASDCEWIVPGTYIEDHETFAIPAKVS